MFCLRLLGGSFRIWVVTTVKNIVFTNLRRREVCSVSSQRTSIILSLGQELGGRSQRRSLDDCVCKVDIKD